MQHFSSKVLVGLVLGLGLLGAGCPPQKPAQEMPSQVTPTRDDVKVPGVTAGMRVTSPWTITGEARAWYFEGSFPVELKTADGVVLAQGIAQAQGDWMVDAFVPFSVTLEFTPPAGGQGVLILRNDNPSGEPQFDKVLEIPVRF